MALILQKGLTTVCYGAIMYIKSEKGCESGIIQGGITIAPLKNGLLTVDEP